MVKIVFEDKAHWVDFLKIIGLNKFKLISFYSKKTPPLDDKIFIKRKIGKFVLLNVNKKKSLLLNDKISTRIYLVQCEQTAWFSFLKIIDLSKLKLIFFVILKDLLWYNSTFKRPIVTRIQVLFSNHWD